MSQLGRLRDLLLRPNGTPAIGATVTVRRQGATVTSNQSGTSPKQFTVADPGFIQVGDTVSIGVGSTTYDVDAVGVDSVTLSGFAGTLALNEGDRITPVNDLPDLFSDAQGVNALAGGNPMETDRLGEFACWVETSPYDLRISGGGFGERLFEDVWPAGIVLVRINARHDDAGQSGFLFDLKDLPSTGRIISFQVDGVDKFYINADGTISGTVAVSVPDPLTLVNGLTVGGLATFNAGAGVVGGLTVDNFTGTGTFTVAAGAIATAAHADNSISSAAVTVRGSAIAVNLNATELVRATTGFTPNGTASKLIITYAANYFTSSSGANVRNVVARLYIDGVLQFPFYAGPTQTITGDLVFPISFTWIASGLSAAAHTIEVRDLYIQQVGAAGVAQYRGDLVQAALIIEELKK